jgi:hypothetical protein
MAAPHVFTFDRARHAASSAFSILARRSSGATGYAIMSRLRYKTSLDVAVIGDGMSGEIQTMPARRVSGAQPFALFCAAGARPVRTEAGMTSSV